MEKDCIFQLATRCQVFANTGLITRGEADELWSSNIMLFIAELSKGNDPEMCIWIDMTSEGCFHTQGRYIHAEDAVVENGELYKVTKEAM